MKAIFRKQYGAPNLLSLRETARPDPKPHELRIKVLAASVNKADWFLLTGKPFPVRLMAGLFHPKYRILGADIAGVVDQAGAAVTQFKVGDEVFGDLSGIGFGGFAEYATATEGCLAKKPTNLDFEGAASLPMAAVTALQGLRDKGRIQAGQQVLINGASGGVGSYAVQIARALGAEVTAVCSASKQEHAFNQGATRVIDYRTRDFTAEGRTYDLIFDVVGNHSLRAIRRALKPGGTCVFCAFSPAALLMGPWLSMISGKRLVNLLAQTNPADLQFIGKMAEEGTLRPVIERCFTLDDVPEALALMGKGGLAGKLVVSI